MTASSRICDSQQDLLWDLWAHLPSAATLKNTDTAVECSGPVYRLLLIECSFWIIGHGMSWTMKILLQNGRNGSFLAIAETCLRFGRSNIVTPTAAYQAVPLLCTFHTYIHVHKRKAMGCIWPCSTLTSFGNSFHQSLLIEYFKHLATRSTRYLPGHIPILS